MSTPNDSPDPNAQDPRPPRGGQNPQYGQNLPDGESQKPAGQDPEPLSYGNQDAPQAPYASQAPNGNEAGQAQQAPYGNQAAPAAGYNYPGNAADTAVADKGPAPKNVNTAYWLTLAAGALYLINSIIQASMGANAMGMGGGAVVAIILALIVTAVYVLLAIFIRKGKNWARITATVLAAINVVVQILGLIGLALISGMDDPAVQDSMAAVSPVNTVLSIIVTILGIIAVILLWTKPARPYFRRAQPAGYSQY